MRTTAKASFYTALNLLFFALTGTALLAWTYGLTRDTIARSVENEKLKLIAQIAPPGTYDNDILQDTAQLAADRLLGGNGTTIAYRGRLNGRPSIAVLQAVAPDGYSGRVNLIVAIHSDGRIGGVRVVSHRETPGLGDYIEIARSDWISGFNGASLDNRRDSEWKVKKDGGSFDYMAGATITPRAIVKAVHKALQYHAQHRDELFAQSSPSSPEADQAGNPPHKGRPGGVKEK